MVLHLVYVLGLPQPDCALAVEQLPVLNALRLLRRLVTVLGAFIVVFVFNIVRRVVLCCLVIVVVIRVICTARLLNYLTLMLLIIASDCCGYASDSLWMC